MTKNELIIYYNIGISILRIYNISSSHNRSNFNLDPPQYQHAPDSRYVQPWNDSRASVRTQHTHSSQVTLTATSVMPIGCPSCPENNATRSHQHNDHRIAQYDRNSTRIAHRKLTTHSAQQFSTSAIACANHRYANVGLTPTHEAAVNGATWRAHAYMHGMSLWRKAAWRRMSRCATAGYPQTSAEQPHTLRAQVARLW